MLQKKVERLLLHTCCADCLVRYLAVLNLKPADELLDDLDQDRDKSPQPDLKNDFVVAHDLVIFFSNVNIYPRAEYDARLEAVRMVAQRYQIPLIIDDYQPKLYFEKVKNDPIRPQRCQNCWTLRLGQTAQKMMTLNQDLPVEQQFSHFSTTLLVSQYQSWPQLKSIGEAQGNFFAPDTKAAKNFRTAGYYKQNFCGCLFSLQEKAWLKFDLAS